jgi:hypothetical protein
VVRGIGLPSRYSEAAPNNIGIAEYERLGIRRLGLPRAIQPPDRRPLSEERRLNSMTAEHLRIALQQGNRPFCEYPVARRQELPHRNTRVQKRLEGMPQLSYPFMRFPQIGDHAPCVLHVASKAELRVWMNER